MHDGLDLTNGLYDAIDSADGLVTELSRLGREKAIAERKYRQEKRVRLLYERANGTPVGIINDVVKGYADISQLAFERDCKTAEYDACREAINLNKRKIDIFREQIAREYRG